MCVPGPVLSECQAPVPMLLWLGFGSKHCQLTGGQAGNESRKGIPTSDGKRKEAAGGGRERKRQRGTEADAGERAYRDPDVGRKEKRGGKPKREPRSPRRPL